LWRDFDWLSEIRLSALGRNVDDLELHRLEATELPACRPCDDIDPVSLMEHRRQVRSAERDRIEDIPAAPQDQLSVSTVR